MFIKEELILNPTLKIFQDDGELIREIKALADSGIPKDVLYVLAHDDERTNRIAEHANANTIGIEEEGLTAAVGNVFRKQGDELREKMQQIGFEQLETEQLEEKLDDGKVLLLINK